MSKILTISQFNMRLHTPPRRLRSRYYWSSHHVPRRLLSLHSLHTRMRSCSFWNVNHLIPWVSRCFHITLSYYSRRHNLYLLPLNPVRQATKPRVCCYRRCISSWLYCWLSLRRSLSSKYRMEMVVLLRDHLECDYFRHGGVVLTERCRGGGIEG